MTQISHDHNFKNLFLDFPKDALKWLLPQVLQAYGDIRHIEFIRQEPKKYRLSDSYRALDLPILFTFEHLKIILWLVEFQEDKHKFSIYKLLHYVTDMMEAHPKAVVVPTVLFTDRRKWREDVALKLEAELCGEIFLQFKYLKIKLYNYHARDYYHSDNPLIKILLPKMKYMPDERTEMICEAYKGLFQLATPMLFDKYVDFIDIYAEVLEEEREHIVCELNTKKETVMLAQYIKDKGIQEGIPLGETNLLCTQIAEKYSISDDKLRPVLENLNSEMLLELGKRILYWDSYDKVQDWIRLQTKNAR